eukprot:scaffold4433_cov35-Tisochrysis_lutea.AAC.1
MEAVAPRAQPADLILNEGGVGPLREENVATDTRRSSPPSAWLARLAQLTLGAESPGASLTLRPQHPPAEQRGKQPAEGNCEERELGPRCRLKQLGHAALAPPALRPPAERE